MEGGDESREEATEETIRAVKCGKEDVLLLSLLGAFWRRTPPGWILASCNRALRPSGGSQTGTPGWDQRTLGCSGGRR
ncbi:hypothetical protein EYF80_066715 [Liparis tanakae]|uniref:Uncharacterized protein n=1 Tax=Liparis tanakae TaxID=230148 RepID=A0A4Z2E336_9TELE|nr:hypothetical protein EYF80_066715 [Liparis tanakae]